MKKNIVAGLFVFSILIILLSLSTQADIFSTIVRKKGLSLDPELMDLVRTITQINYPKSVVGNYVIKPIAGEAMQLIAEESPEAAQAIQQYNQVKGWVDEGAQITEDLKLTEDAELAGGSITIDDKERDVSSLVNSEFEEGSIKVKDMEVSSKGEEEDVTFTAKKGGYVEIDGERYENLKEGSTISIGRDGSVTEAKITTTKAGTYEFGGREIQVEKDTKIIYKDGILVIEGKGKTIELDGQEIKLGEGGILVDGQTIIGDFTLDEKRFSGEVTLVEEGYLLGGNTEVETKGGIIVTTPKDTPEEGGVLFSKTCGDVSGFDNHVNPCRGTLTMEGEGFSVQLKEGRQFGLEIPEGGVLKFDMGGGKVSIEDGGVEIDLKKQGSSVKVTNGEVKITHELTDEGIKITTDPDSIGEKPDVELTTATKGSACAIETNPEGIQTYHCPIETSSQATTDAIADATGMFDFKKLKEKCMPIVNGVKNSVKGKVEKLGSLKRKPLTLSDGTTKLYTKTLKSVKPADVGSDCANCNAYRIKGVDKEGKTVKYIIIINEDGMAGYYREGEGGKKGRLIHILEDYEEQAIGLEVPEELEEIDQEGIVSKPSGEIEYFNNGVWYMKDGTVWQRRSDGSVVCVNC